MNIYTAEQFREWDQYTITHEPIRSIDLMERAAKACIDWMGKHQYLSKCFSVFCEKGNNGGDGLAIARMLLQKGSDVRIYILEEGRIGTPDFQENLHRLHALTHELHFIQAPSFFPRLDEDNVIIDALFGTGLNRQLSTLATDLAEYINRSGNEVISVDLPSGMMADSTSKNSVKISATHTLCFERLKKCMLMAENADFTGHIHILPIGLHPGYEETLSCRQQLIDISMIRSLMRSRHAFAHKGHFGHALVVAGSEGKMGAAVLSTSSLLRSGAGLTTAYIPSCGKNIFPIAVPEAMTEFDPDEIMITKVPLGLQKYSAIGIGPGLGTDAASARMLETFIREVQSPLVLDADALNILATRRECLKQLPKGSVLTPHPKEWERLCGVMKDDFERHQFALEKAREWNCVIVLKGHHTLIATPEGDRFYNTTGNPGMAKGGSGDVLTGLITGLLAQGYSANDAAQIGVYWHGLAGDHSALSHSEQSMTARDIISDLGKAWLNIAT